MVHPAAVITAQHRDSLMNSAMHQVNPHTDGYVQNSYQHGNHLYSDYLVKNEPYSPSVISDGSPLQPNYAHMAESPVKMSPGYMDAEEPFRYPDPPSSSCRSSPRNFGTNENPSLDHSLLFQQYFSNDVPKIERQHSLNTVMQVIDNQANDAAIVHPQQQALRQRVQQSRPINIQRPSALPESRPQSNFSTDPYANQTRLLPPPAYTSGSYNNVETYQYVDSPSDYNLQETPREHWSGGVDDGAYMHNYSHAEEQMSPNLYPYSPFQSDTSSPLFTPSSSDYHDRKDLHVFNFDNVSGQFQPSQSCSDFLSFSHQQMNTNQPTEHPGTSSAPTNYPPQTHSNLSASSSNTLPSHRNMHLEEVDSSAFSKAYDRTDSASLTETERIDRRRIRNNLACRMSRERRKRRAREREALVSFLSNKNRKMKEQVQFLEKEVEKAKAEVKMRMQCVPR